MCRFRARYRTVRTGGIWALTVWWSRLPMHAPACGYSNRIHVQYAPPMQHCGRPADRMMDIQDTGYRLLCRTLTVLHWKR